MHFKQLYLHGVEFGKREWGWMSKKAFWGGPRVGQVQKCTSLTTASLRLP